MMHVNRTCTDNAPCKGCVDRHLGCHDHCPKYLQYKIRMENARLERVERAEMNNTVVDLESSRYRNMHKRKRVGI